MASTENQNENATPTEMNSPTTFWDKMSLAFATFGVGYLPLAPGTWGSIVGVLIYLGYRHFYFFTRDEIYSSGWIHENYAVLGIAKTGVLLIAFCLVGILASARVERLLGDKDPQIIVVDEIMGQLIVFAFVSFSISMPIIIIGFVLFRVFDIWKPYPIKAVEKLSNGVGVCADDIVAGVYAGVCLSVIYSVSLLI